MSDIWAEIDAGEILGKDDPKARTVQQIAEAWGCCENAARTRIKAMLAEGRLESRKVLRSFGDCRRQVTVYLPVGVRNGQAS